MTNLTAERTASTPNTTSKVVLVSGPGPGDAAMMLGDLRIEEDFPPIPDLTPEPVEL